MNCAFAFTGASKSEARHVFMSHQQSCALADESIALRQLQAVPAHVQLNRGVPTTKGLDLWV